MPLLLAALAIAATAAAAAKVPHILTIIVDDWGRYDIGFRGNAEAKTPALDELAATGLILDRAYTFKYCSPSRSAFQSGRNPVHVNVFNLDPQAFNVSDPDAGYPGIARNMTGIAEKMKLAGAKTHFAGKWDAGCSTPDHIPTGRGYDSSFGYLLHFNDYWTQQSFETCTVNGIATPSTDLWASHAPAHGRNGSWACNQTNQAGCVFEDEMITQYVLDTIAAHDPAAPLFLVWAPHVVHGPLQAPQAYVDRFANLTDWTRPRQLYMAMVAYIDDKIAAVVAALQARGLYEDTLIVVSSDNGGPVNGGANNYPLRGGKFSNWEGGLRVTSLVSGGFLPAQRRGAVETGLVTLWDWYATFCGLAGVDAFDAKAAAAGLPPVDSVDLWPLISGANSTSPRAALVIGSPSDPTSGGEGPPALLMNVTVQGVLSPPYKLLIGPLTMSVWTGTNHPNASGPVPNYTAIHHCADPAGTAFPLGPGCLFDVFADPGETVDLAQKPEYAAVKATLRDLIAQAQAGVFNPRRGVGNLTALCAGVANAGGFVAPFLP